IPVAARRANKCVVIASVLKAEADVNALEVGSFGAPRRGDCPVPLLFEAAVQGLAAVDGDLCGEAAGVVAELVQLVVDCEPYRISSVERLGGVVDAAAVGSARELKTVASPEPEQGVLVRTGVYKA